MAATKKQWPVHLIVISGLHIGIACLLGYLLGVLLQAVVGRLRPASSDLRLLRVIPALLFATGYAALAGFSIPTQRALVMAIMLLIPPLFNLMPSLWQRWWLALTVVLVWQPLSINQAGLWLSFTAVAALLLIYQSGSNRGRWSKVYQVLLSQRAIFIGLLPLLVMFSGGFSVWAPLINLLAIPYVSFILLPASLLLLAMLPLYPDLIVFILDALIWVFWAGLDLVAGEQALIDVPSRSIWVIITASIGALLLVLPRLVFFRLLGCFLLLPLIKPASSLPENGMFRAWVFDVGQGLSVMVQTRHHLLLYDTGAGFRTGGGVALYSVIPAMQSMGLRRIDRLVISHADNDHAGGYAVIAEAFEVGLLESGSPKWRRRNAANACDSGQRWRWDGVAFQYVHPQKAAVKSENNNSCVLLVESAGCSLLIPGDIESVVEHQILSEIPQLNVHWLIASHHGSRFSSDKRWLQGLDPQEVIFSAGLSNSYGHPAPEVVSRVQAQGSRWRSTASAGAVLLEEIVAGCHSSAYRDEKKRYWSDG
ncbi:MAG: DNA internalization-related competence protein ComEC/Rec2 [Amphritea sp.]